MTEWQNENRYDIFSEELGTVVFFNRIIEIAIARKIFDP